MRWRGSRRSGRTSRRARATALLLMRRSNDYAVLVRPPAERDAADAARMRERVALADCHQQRANWQLYLAEYELLHGAPNEARRLASDASPRTAHAPHGAPARRGARRFGGPPMMGEMTCARCGRRVPVGLGVMPGGAPAGRGSNGRRPVGRGGSPSLWWHSRCSCRHFSSACGQRDRFFGIRSPSTLSGLPRPFTSCACARRCSCASACCAWRASMWRNRCGVPK